MLTPLPRDQAVGRRGRVATLDSLSGGRVQLAVGLGAAHPGWLAFETDEGRKVRAEKLDEGLAVYDGLMRGQPFAFHGEHYGRNPTDFVAAAASVQQPRVPVWVVGAHPSIQSLGASRALGRAAPHDRRPQAADTSSPPTTSRDRRRHTASARGEAGLPWEGYDVVAEGVSDPGRGRVEPRWPPTGGAGANLWVESDWSMGDDALAQAPYAHRGRAAEGLSVQPLGRRVSHRSGAASAPAHGREATSSLVQGPAVNSATSSVVVTKPSACATNAEPAGTGWGPGMVRPQTLARNAATAGAPATSGEPAAISAMPASAVATSSAPGR